MSIGDAGLWAVTDVKGHFTITDVHAGTISIGIQHLGFAKGVYGFDVKGDTTGVVLPLAEQNLTLDEVVITAEKSSGLTTSYNIDRTVLDHMQMLGVRDTASLLPGGKTNTALHLAEGPQTFCRKWKQW